MHFIQNSWIVHLFRTWVSLEAFEIHREIEENVVQIRQIAVELSDYADASARKTVWRIA